MKRRAFGLETEYSVACRKKDDRRFYTNLPSLFMGKDVVINPPSLFLKNALPYGDDSPEHLRSLLLYPPKHLEHFWFGSNGARFYFDMHGTKLPEYATPECATPREAIINSMAGDGILEDLRREVIRQRLLEHDLGGEYNDIFVFRMTAFFRDDIYEHNAVGCHENYTTIEDFAPKRNGPRSFYRFRDSFVPFLITRQVFDGSGGIRCDPEKGWQYVISQRAFFIAKRASPDTTSGGQRGLINFRSDMQESPPGFVRLHLHCGDLTMSPWGKYIAMAATHLLLRAFEETDCRNFKYCASRYYFKSDLRALSADPTLKTKIHVLHGDALRLVPALALQREFAEFVARSLSDMSPEEEEMLRAWQGMIEKLERDHMEAAEELDWVIKLNFLNERCGGNFESEKAQFASALYHDVADRGIYNTLLRGGRVMPFATSEEVAACRRSPPATRAEFRARYIKLLLQNPDDTERTISLWENFPDLYAGSIVIPDPLARTTRQGEEFLAELQKTVDRRKRKRG